MKILNENSDNEKYLSDNPENKVFAVDTYVNLVKVLKIEAATKDEAEEKAIEYVKSLLQGVDEMETGRVLANDGFHDCEDIEPRVSGEADGNGDIQYY